MRHTVLALTMGLSAFVLTSEPAAAETCTGYTKQCRQKCATGRNPSLCLKECSTYQRQCMKSGKWIGRNTKDYNVEKR